MYVKKPKLDTSGRLPIPPTRNHPLPEDSTITSSLTPHLHSPPHRMVHGNSENVLDHYRSIQLPLPPWEPTSSVTGLFSSPLLKNLTHPSELGKRSSGMSRMKGQGAVGFSVTKERKRKSVDYPNVFDHLAVLHRKQQKYQAERDSQEVPLSPQVEPACELLSLHSTPSRPARKAKQITLNTSEKRMLFGPEPEHRVAMSTNCRRDLKDALEVVSKECSVAESQTSQTMPVPSLECIGPSQRHLQLAQVPSLGCVRPMDHHLYSPRTSFLVPVIAEPPPNLPRGSCNTRERSRSPVDVRNFSILHYYPREE